MLASDFSYYVLRLLIFLLPKIIWLSNHSTLVVPRKGVLYWKNKWAYYICINRDIDIASVTTILF